MQEFLIKVAAYSDRAEKLSYTEEAAQISKLLIGAMIGVDLIIFQALLSISPADSFVVTSITALGVALPTSGGFLFIRFWQEKLGVQGYGSILIKLLATLSIGATATGVYSAIAHISLYAANVFFVTFIGVCTIITIYARSLRKERAKN